MIIAFPDNILQLAAFFFFYFSFLFGCRSLFQYIFHVTVQASWATHYTSKHALDNCDTPRLFSYSVQSPIARLRPSFLDLLRHCVVRQSCIAASILVADYPSIPRSLAPIPRPVDSNSTSSAQFPCSSSVSYIQLAVCGGALLTLNHMRSAHGLVDVQNPVIGN